MNGISIQVNLPNYGKYKPSELQHILTQIAMDLIEETDVSFPCSCTEDEAKSITLQRGQDIKNGKAELIPHNKVMSEMNQLVASYAD